MIEFTPTGKYRFAIGDTEVWNAELFSTKEEAKSAGEKMMLENEWEGPVYVGEVTKHFFGDFLVADVIITNALECARDYVRESDVDEFEAKLSKEAMQELQRLLVNWVEKYKLDIKTVKI